MASPLSSKLDWNIANPIWAASLNPVLANPLNGVRIITATLVAGSNIINHSLGRTMQGWFLTDIQAAATIYRSAPMSSVTLTLMSSAPVTVDIGVF